MDKAKGIYQSRRPHATTVERTGTVCYFGRLEKGTRVRSDGFQHFKGVKL